MLGAEQSLILMKMGVDETPLPLRTENDENADWALIVSTAALQPSWLHPLPYPANHPIVIVTTSYSSYGYHKHDGYSYQDHWDLRQLLLQLWCNNCHLPTKAITYFISSYPGFLAFPATAPTLASTPAQQPMATNTRDYSCLCCHSDSFAPFYLLSLLFKKKKNCNTKVSLSKQKNLNFRQDWESVIGGDHIFLVHAFSILSRVQSLSLCIPNGTPSGY